MQPLVLAIEPDLRQAAIVKRIVREKVLADVTVVDTRDAALEAMRTSVPDVLLLSALLSPRDEDELFAHLRTLEHAEHLQTHTIPQLASAIAPGEEKPSKGLLSSFWRRKESGRAPAGCDPDLFADEIRTYLHRASEKKREVRDAVAAGPIAAAVPPRGSARAVEAPPAPAATSTSSSWESPFEWRPSGSTKPLPTAAPVQVLAPAVQRVESVEPPLESLEMPADIPDPIVASVEPSAFSTEPLAASVEPPAFSPEPLVASVEPPAFSPEPLVANVEPPAFILEPSSLETGSPVLSVESAVPTFEPRPRLPLVVRHSREWWFEDDGARANESDADSEWRAVPGALAVPLQVAAIGYANGCWIRRVRLVATS